MKYNFFIKFFRWKKLFEPNLSPFWKVGAWDCIKWWHVVVVANCSKFKASEEFLHVQLLTGGPSWDFWGRCGCSVTSHTYLKTPKLWRKEPNWNCSMYKASEEFLYSLVSHREVPTEAIEAVALAALPANPKEKSQNYSKEPKLFKNYLWYQFVVPENLKKERKLTILYYSDYNGMSQCWIFAFI